MSDLCSGSSHILFFFPNSVSLDGFLVDVCICSREYLLDTLLIPNKFNGFGVFLFDMLYVSLPLGTFNRMLFIYTSLFLIPLVPQGY